MDWRDGKRVARLLKAARLKVSSACMEDIDWRAGRGLDRHLVTALAGGDWIRHGRNVLITGATGCGKTWLGARWRSRPHARASACSTPAPPGCCRSCRWPMATAASAAVWPSWRGWMSWCWTTWPSHPIAAQERQDLLELLDDRVGSRSTLITSQLPTSAWHAWLAEPTIADAIMDRLLHGSHTLALKGESLRRAKAQA
jgi:DNA replication protein DnaC